MFKFLGNFLAKKKYKVKDEIWQEQLDFLSTDKNIH